MNKFWSLALHKALMEQRSCVIVIFVVIILGCIQVECNNDIFVDTSHYHNYTTLQKLFRRLSDENPSLARLYSIGKSVQGRQLYVLRISSNLDQVKESEDYGDNLRFKLNGKPMFKYVANMHVNNILVFNIIFIEYQIRCQILCT